MPRPPSTPKQGEAAPGDGQPRVWVLRDGQPEADRGQDRRHQRQVTEILGGDLKAGSEVITEAVVSTP